jgi:hypothetical protein
VRSGNPLIAVRERAVIRGGETLTNAGQVNRKKEERHVREE